MTDSYRKQVKVGSADVVLDILDTAGHEVRDQYIRPADVVIIMYSVTNQRSFTTVKQVCIIMEYTRMIAPRKGLKMCLFLKIEDSYPMLLKVGSTEVLLDITDTSGQEAVIFLVIKPTPVSGIVPKAK